MIEKRNPDWYKLQQDMQGWDEIAPDQKIIDFIADKGWSLNLDYCHNNLKKKLEPYNVTKEYTDFFVLTDLEVSKLPLPFLLKMIRHMYSTCTVGGYIAVLSYYLNSSTRYNYADTYSENIRQYFLKELSFVTRIEDRSCVADNPINIVKDGLLYDGSNFIFVHPNIRYMLWK